ARVARLDLPGPRTAVGENAPIVVRAANENIRGLRRHDDFQGPRRHHHEGHAGGGTQRMVEENALTTAGLIGGAVFEDLLILRRQRRLLSASPWLGLIE